MAKEKPLSSPEGRGDEQETRERILIAARNLMATKGFKGATTKLIAEAAGVNEVTIFRHFGSKEGILLSLVEELTNVQPIFEQSLQRDFDSLEEMFIHYGRTFYGILWERKEVILICMIEVESRSDRDLNQVFSRVPLAGISVLYEKLIRLHAEGKIREADFRVAAHMFVSSFLAAFIMIHRVQIKEFPFDEEHLYKSVADTLLNGLKLHYFPTTRSEE